MKDFNLCLTFFANLSYIIHKLYKLVSKEIKTQVTNRIFILETNLQKVNKINFSDKDYSIIKSLELQIEKDKNSSFVLR